MFQALSVLLLAASSVKAHAFISSVQGANGVSVAGFGVDPSGSIGRDGTVEQPFQLDTPVLKDLATDPCGATLLAGSINIKTEMTAALKAGGGELPTIPTNGSITLGLHQVNADGGGPFTAEINEDGTGKTWVAATVTSQPPGVAGLLHNGPADSFITVEMPNGVTCTGGQGDACIIRLNNGGPNTGSVANGAGPFGGCVAVSQANAATGNGNANANKNANANNNANANTAATGNNRNSNGKNRNNNKRKIVYSRHFYPSLAKRQEAVRELEQIRSEIDSELIRKRQLLTAQLIDELKTATGTAIDIPIDALAGQIDETALGGNSTTAKNAIITSQQAVDLKKAVQLAIEQAFLIMANGDVDAGANGQDESITDKANADANAAIADGSLTSINAGNAGVGEPNTAVVNSLLGGLATATQAIAAGATTSAPAVTATATSTSNNTNAGATNNNTGNNRNGGNRNGGNRNNRNNKRRFQPRRTY